MGRLVKKPGNFNFGGRENTKRGIAGRLGGISAPDILHIRTRKQMRRGGRK